MTYKVSDIRSMIQESSNEFKAKLGPGVESGNKTNNGKAYKDAEKRAKDYDGGLADSIKVAKYDKTKEGDDNRTTLDYEVDNVDQKYKDRIKAQAEGYTSVAEKENGIEKQGDYEGNNQIFQGITDDADQWKEKMVNARASGLAARTYDKEKTFKHGDLYEKKEGKKKAEPEGWRDPVRRGIWPKEENDEKEEKKETNENKNVKTDFFKKKTFKHGDLYESKYVKKSNPVVIINQLKKALANCEGENNFKCIFAKNCLDWLEKNSGCRVIAVGTTHFLADIIKQCYFGEENEEQFIEELERGKNIVTTAGGTKLYTSDNIFGFVDNDGGALYIRKIDTSEPSQTISEKKEKNVKTAFFKKTTFLTEGHMMSRIPDEFKVEENVFRMKDKTGNEYLLEWKDGKAEIIDHKNKQGMNESVERMKALFNYKASDYYKNTTTSSRLMEENEGFTNTLDKARKIIK